MFFFGKDILKEGLKTYFAKYAFKNTELKDFIAKMANAQKSLGVMLNVDLVQWRESWLKTAGYN